MEMANAPSVLLVLGGVRSGKSRYAQQLAEPMSRVAFVATGVAVDHEMSLRIAQHRSERPAHWRTEEEPLEIASALQRLGNDHNAVIVDCLTVYAANLMSACEQDRAQMEARVDQLCQVLASPACPVVLVSNEVGSGVVPPYPAGRVYRDLLGWINQRVAAVATDVVLMVAGLPFSLKAAGRLTAAPLLAMASENPSEGRP